MAFWRLEKYFIWQKSRILFLKRFFNCKLCESEIPFRTKWIVFLLETTLCEQGINSHKISSNRQFAVWNQSPSGKVFWIIKDIFMPFKFNRRVKKYLNSWRVRFRKEQKILTRPKHSLRINYPNKVNKRLIKILFYFSQDSNSMPEKTKFMNSFKESEIKLWNY